LSNEAVENLQEIYNDILIARVFQMTGKYIEYSLSPKETRNVRPISMASCV
jgi:hypothetical protein